MLCVRLHGGGKLRFSSPTSCPLTAHLPLPWIMGYDLYPMTTLENKKKWIPEVVKEGWIALFGHDPKTPAAYVRERDGEMGTRTREGGLRMAKTTKQRSKSKSGKPKP